MSKKKGDFQNKLIALGGEKPSKSKQNETKLNTESSTITTRAKSTTPSQQNTQSIDPLKMKEEIDKVMDLPLNDKLNKIVIPFINQLKQTLNNNNKQQQQQQTEHTHYFITLTYLLLKRPQFFLKQPNIIEMIISLFKLLKDTKFSISSSSSSSSSNHQIQLLQFLCTFLNRLYSHEDFFHIDLYLKAFIDDWLGERIWCDNDLCREFALNLISCFKTKQIPFSLENINEENGNVNNLLSMISQTNQIKAITNEIEVNLVDTIKEITTKRIIQDNKYLIKLLHLASGLSEIRLFAIGKLDTWLNNPKLAVCAQDLLLAICINCKENDVELIQNLVKLKPKPKLQQHFLDCLKEVMKISNYTFELVFSQALINEVTRTRDQHNSNQIQLSFNFNPKLAAKLLAINFQKFLIAKEDNLKLIRSILRETIRNTKNDFDILVFTSELLNDIRFHVREFCEFDERTREKYVSNISDLITVCQFISITPQIKDAYLKRSQETKNILIKYYQQASQIQAQAVTWLQSIVREYKISPIQRINSLLKVLFMVDKTETYYNVDDWPPDKDRTYMLRVVSEIPVSSETLLQILFMTDCLTIKYILDLEERLLKTASFIQHKDPTLFSSFELTNTDAYLTALFKITLYSYSSEYDSILPKNYTPPLLTITAFYWKAIQILLLLSVLDAKGFGQIAWRQYPTLRICMEILMTEDYSFPPQTSISQEMTNEKYRLIELDLQNKEKAEILELETYFKSTPTQQVVLTEKDSYLIGQVMKYDPKGPARRLPNDLLQNLKKLNTDYKLGQYLCKCRNPDYLLELIKTQSSTLSLSWLASLIESNNECLDIMPIECICEFVWNLLSGENEIQLKKSISVETLLNRIETIIFTSNTSQESIQQINDVFTYFLNKLNSEKSSVRTTSMKIIQKIFLKNMDYQFDFKAIIERIKKISAFEISLKKLLVDQLLKTLFIETQPDVVYDYLVFILNQINADSKVSSNSNTCKSNYMIIANFFLTRMNLVDKLFDSNKNNKLNEIEIFNSINESLQLILKINEFNDDQQVLNTLTSVHYRPDSKTNSYLLIKIDTNRIIYLHESLYYIIIYFCTKHHNMINLNLINDLFNENLKYLNTKESILIKETLNSKMIEIILLKSNEHSIKIYNKLINELDLNDLLAYLTRFYGIPNHIVKVILLRVNELAIESQNVDLSPYLNILRVYLNENCLLDSPAYEYLSRYSCQCSEKTEKLFEIEDNSYESELVEQSDDFSNVFNRIVQKQTNFCDKMEIQSTEFELNDHLESLILKYQYDQTLELMLRQYLISKVDGLEQLTNLLIHNNINLRRNLIDLCIDLLVKNDTKFNFELLFKSQSSDTNSFLLSLFLSQSNWNRIAEFKQKLLSSNTNEYINSKQALDFLQTLINLPELWKCTDFKMRRDSNTNETNDYCFFDLNEAQLQVIVDLIIDEFHHCSVLNNDCNLFMFRKRVQILQHFLRNDKLKTKLSRIVDYTQERSNYSIANLILYELYLNEPNIVFNIEKPNKIFPQLIKCFNETSRLDIKIHHLLSTFQEIELSTRKNEVSIVNSKKQEALLIDSNYVCLNLASNHPWIFIRYLPMLEGILQGKVIYSFDDFKRRKIDKLFHYVIDLMAILVPLIFNMEYLSHLDSIICHYFDIFRNYCLENYEFGSLVVKFMDFLEKFINFNCKIALDILSKYSVLIGTLQKAYSDNHSLKYLNNLLINPPTSSTEITSLYIPKATTRFWSAKQLEPFVNKLLNRDNSVGVIQVLRELNAVSQRQSLILTDFVYYLNDFLFDSNDLIRDLAQTLIMRFLRLHPKESYSFLSLYCECLIHDNVKIFQSAIKIFSDFTLLCSHKAQYLFKYALRGSLKHNIDISKQLSDSLRLLQLDKHIYNN